MIFAEKTFTDCLLLPYQRMASAKTFAAKTFADMKQFHFVCTFVCFHFGVSDPKIVSGAVML